MFKETTTFKQIFLKFDGWGRGELVSWCRGLKLFILLSLELSEKVGRPTYLVLEGSVVWTSQSLIHTIYSSTKMPLGLRVRNRHFCGWISIGILGFRKFGYQNYVVWILPTVFWFPESWFAEYQLRTFGLQNSDFRISVCNNRFRKYI